MVSAVGSGTDWVGIAPVGSESSERWWYVTSVGSGTTFDLTATLSGDEKTGEFAAGEYLIASKNNFQQKAEFVLPFAFVMGTYLTRGDICGIMGVA